MPASENSLLEPLSSPSPSPPPAKSKKLNDAPSAGLDSESELSELTEEEHETENSSRNKKLGRRGSRVSKSTRGLRSPRRGGRRKRSSLVPAPMWGWAESKGPNAVEEEEEEELSGPHRPMEEEEGPEEEEEEEHHSEPDRRIPDVETPKSAVQPASLDEAEGEISEEEPPRDDTESEEELDKLEDMGIAEPGPAIEESKPLTTAMSVASIMGGTVPIRGASRSPSSSAESSRSPTPDGVLAKPTLSPVGLDADEKAEAENDQDALEGESASAGPIIKPKDNLIPDPDQEPDVVIDENSAYDDMDGEQELELQPAHRAEALDVLAILELKFAMLRERVYVEKMDALAWEEALVADGSHPELLHLHRELSTRKDRRLELATARRTLELTAATKKRRLDEDATWNWWRLARDDLQTEMIAETNRKRRKLERDRRTIERPQPVRRIPIPLEEVPPAPTLREIVKSFPFGGHLNKDDGPRTLVYPELSTLNRMEIAQDFENFYPRPTNFDGPRPTGPGSQIPTSSAPIGYESYNDTFPHAPPGGNRQPIPNPASFHSHAPSLHQGPGQPYPTYPSGPPPGRQPSHLSAGGHNITASSNIHAPSPFTIDHEMDGSPYGYFGPGPSHSGVAYPSSLATQHTTQSRRSPSPPAITKGNGQWMGPGMGMGGFGTGPSKSEWPGESRRQVGSVADEEDRHRGRERERADRERERLERLERERRDREHHDAERTRDYHLQAAMQQQHRHTAVPHQHVHGTTSSHHHGSHHHHRQPHHHHVLHHHHGSQASSAPSGLQHHHGTHGAVDVVNIPSKGAWNDEVPEYAGRSNKHGTSRAINGLASSPADDRDRPVPMQFTMAPSHGSMRSPPRNSKGNVSPRWSQPEENFRVPHENRPHSPARFAPSSHRPGQQHMRQNSLGLSPPTHPRIHPPTSPGTSTRSPTRYRERSPPGMKMHRLTPPPNAKALPPQGSIALTNSVRELAGPGRTATPTTVSGRPMSPSRSNSGTGREHEQGGFGIPSTLLPPALIANKLQTVDNH